jgi:hypothetical protein
MADRNTTPTPETLVNTELAKGTPRSPEYRAGMLDVLNSLMRGVSHTIPPHPVGTAAFDAYYAGNDRGHEVWCHLIEGAGQPANELAGGHHG